MEKSEAYELIAPYLQQGETVVWIQRAPALRLAMPQVPPLLFAVIVTGGALWLTFMFGWSTELRDDEHWIGVALGGALSAVSFVFALWRLRELRAGAFTLYAVTDRAALIIEDLFPRRVRRFDREPVSTRRRSGDRITFLPASSANSVTGDERFDPSASFIGVLDIASVEAALNRIVRGESAFTEPF